MKSKGSKKTHAQTARFLARAAKMHKQRMAGKTLAEIGKEHRISRQAVHIVLQRYAERTGKPASKAKKGKKGRRK
jgi:hypothetical protein